MTDELIACDADEPPAAYTRDLVHVCTLTTDLDAVPRGLFTRLTTMRGIEFDNLDFTLEMTVDSAGLGFELKVDGVRYGRVEAEFRATDGQGALRRRTGGEQQQQRQRQRQ